MSSVQSMIFSAAFMMSCSVWAEPSDHFSRNCERSLLGLERSGSLRDWDEFPWSDPNHFSQDSFRFRVHAVQLFHFSPKLKDIFQVITHSTQSQPVSFSVIDQDHPFTYANNPGFILSFGSDRIVAASNQDLGSHFHYAQQKEIPWVESLQRKFGIASPKGMNPLKANQYWNEGVIDADIGIGKSQVQIQGIFVFENTDPEWVSQLKAFADLKKLPFLILKSR